MKPGLATVGALFPLILLLFSGCGGSDPNLPPLVPASGTVTLDGKPLSGAQIAFLPVGSTRGGEVIVGSDEKGHYELKSRYGDGAPVGEYRVVITKLLMPDGSDFTGDAGIAPMDSPARQVLAARYADSEQTQLKATVPEGGSDALNFALTSAR